MSNDRKSLQVNELDFEGIRGNISSFLKDQDKFSDYNFEASGLSVLLDVLSYFTHYQGLYNNLIANELFLDTAVKRSSVVSQAKSLGYTPRSVSAPTARVNLTLNNSTNNLLRRGSVFTGRNGNTSYTFVATDDQVGTVTGTSTTFSDVPIREGIIRTSTFVVPSNDNTQKYTIPDEKIDTKTIVVQVLRSVNDNEGITDVWTNANTKSTVGSDDTVYFLDEEFTGVFSVSFGDGVMGRKVSAGNVILISYLQSSGAAANSLGLNDSETNRAFVYNGDTNSVVEVVEASAGGGAKESIASIRSNAPKAYAAQNRAVTTNDYEAIINNNFSGFRSVYVYGGEDAEPPEFGKVFIALNPTIGSITPTSLKGEIESFMKTRCPVSITPEVIDPDFIFIKYNSNVVFNPSLTVLSTDQVKDEVRRLVFNYISQNTVNFNTSVSLSGLQKSILDGLPEVQSLTFNPLLEFRFTPAINTVASYQINFRNPIFHPHEGHSPVVSSNDFIYIDSNGQQKVVKLDDDGRGKLRVYQLSGNVRNYLETDFGTIDYASGKLSLNSFALNISSDSSIKITVEITGSRIASSNKSILQVDQLDPSYSNIIMTADDRPDRRLVTDTASAEYIGTSSISQQISTSSSTTTYSSTSGAGAGSGSGSGSGGGSSSGGGGGGGGGYGGGY